ncbi:CopG family antitoxin [Polynucleobacter parvulilacunae]|uniref:CopG family antitoxin n=1 Tax=Polynucleobacter parvulilacunae TaxID=1855631 RepID=UPI0034E2D316
MFASELDERRFWEVNDASDYFDLNKAFRAAIPNLRPHSATMRSQDGVVCKFI